MIDLEKKAANDQMKTLLLRSVSHELRTPLNSIIHFTDELIEKSAFLDKDDQKKIKMISISSKLMLSLINDLMDYSKIITGVFSVQRALCSLKEIIKNTIELYKFQAERKEIYLTSRIDPDIPDLIYTDPMRFSQILLNLLGNALKYTSKGKIEICLVISSRQMIKCIVEDTGVGIDKKSIKKIFKTLNTTNIPYLGPTGNGLGLYISNLLVKHLSGKSIKIKSSLGSGSSFSFKTDICLDNDFSTVEEKVETHTDKD